MLDTTPVLWLQGWASPALTEIMLAVSLWGYVPSCLVFATVCAFGWRFRLGVTLVLAIVFADALTVVAKSAFALPRPHVVDARVRTPVGLESRLSSSAAGTSVPADAFGFPSGHVATTTAWVLGLAWSHRKPWQLGAAGTWIALMALSRMYLGRHFPADVAGGLVVGVAGLAIARLQFPPAAGASPPTVSARTALGVSLGAVVALATLSGAGLGAHGAGRFCGVVGAAVLLAYTRALDDRVSPARRMARVAVALVLLGVATGSNTWTIVAGPNVAVISTMVVSAALHASVLLVPALAPGRNRP
jgi:membrane-associated phospholipid phosphatase